MTPLYGGIELGGTKTVVALGTGPDDVHALDRFPTTSPEETMARAVAFFRAQPEAPAAVGVGAFGPVEVDPARPNYGCLLDTPKLRWRGGAVVGPLRNGLGVPVVLDTDVNVAALGEHRWGAGQGADPLLYLTVGTGVGGGVVVHGRPLQGLLHPEMGHVLLPRHPEDDFAGTCPFHGACLEGLAAGPALEARWGTRAENLPEDHPAWPLEAYYLAAALAGFVVVLMPRRIIMGGGVMQQPHLFPLIRQQLRTLLNGYVARPELDAGLDAYVVPPALGHRAGVLGALALAMTAETA